MNLLDWINQGVDTLSNTASPGIDALGFRIFVALLTAMMVWFGVQEALASAQGGSGFNMAKFVHFVVLGSFTYTLIEFYHSAIPGVGYSFHDFITAGATSVANMIGLESINQMLDAINTLQGQAGSDILKAIMSPYYAIVVVMIQFLLAIFSAVIAAIVAYGVLAAAVAGLLGPLFIPFLLVDKLNFLFWGWLRAFIGFSFYKIVAAAVMVILGHLAMLFYSDLMPLDPATLIAKMPLLILLIVVNVYLLFKIPAITSSIFSGHTGHGGEVINVLADRLAGPSK
jgi:hypothetical protein